MEMFSAIARKLINQRASQSDWRELPSSRDYMLMIKYLLGLLAAICLMPDETALRKVRIAYLFGIRASGGSNP